jgi:hypothetical protein
MSVQVFKTITAENQFTDPIRIMNHGSITVSGTFTANVHLQMRPYAASDWVDTGDDPLTVPCHKAIEDYSRYEYRAGVPTGSFGIGSVDVVLKSGGY